MAEIEIPLSGGNITESVVRVGDTVRRSVGANSDNVHHLLRHLENAGFDHAPRFLGIDDKGREILSYLPGSTDFPTRLWQQDAGLVAATVMLRSYHDATVGLFPAPMDGWAFCHADTTRHEVICHNDFAPYNMVFDKGLPVGIIDFDLAGPGPRLRDLAYLAYWFAPLSFASGDLSEASQREVAAGNPRLRLICQTYGTDDHAGLIDMVAEVLRHMASEAAAVQMIGAAAARKLRDGGHFTHWTHEATAFDANRGRIADNLATTP